MREQRLCRRACVDDPTPTWTDGVEDVPYEPSRILVREVPEAVPQTVRAVVGSARGRIAHVSDDEFRLHAELSRPAAGRLDRFLRDVDTGHPVAAAGEQKGMSPGSTGEIEKPRPRLDGEIANEEVHLLGGCGRRDGLVPELERERAEERLVPFGHRRQFSPISDAPESPGRHRPIAPPCWSSDVATRLRRVSAFVK